MKLSSKTVPLTSVLNLFSMNVFAFDKQDHPKGKISSKHTVLWRIFIFSAILALTGLFFTPHLDAEIYQWVDENGVKHYSNSPPADAGNVKIVSKEYRYDETADQERVQADQKTIDTLTEKTKKEQPSASVADQKKSEEAEQKQPPSEAADTKSDADCYLKASIDVRVIVWHADRSGNKGTKIWEGVLKQGEIKPIRTPDGNIRYAHRRNLAEDQYFSGDKNRYCENGQEISVP